MNSAPPAFQYPFQPAFSDEGTREYFRIVKKVSIEKDPGGNGVTIPAVISDDDVEHFHKTLTTGLYDMYQGEPDGVKYQLAFDLGGCAELVCNQGRPMSAVGSEFIGKLKRDPKFPAFEHYYEMGKASAANSSTKTVPDPPDASQASVGTSSMGDSRKPTSNLSGRDASTHGSESGRNPAPLKMAKLAEELAKVMLPPTIAKTGSSQHTNATFASKQSTTYPTEAQLYNAMKEAFGSTLGNTGSSVPEEK